MTLERGARDSWVGAARRDNDAGPDPAEVLACGVERGARAAARAPFVILCV